MSVLKSRRSLSSAEYVNTANTIYVETLGFLSRLSARYSRLMAADVAHHASEVMAYTEKANSIMPTDEVRFNERKVCLMRARGALMALDVSLGMVYEVLMQNPEGAFSKSSGATIPAKQATERLGKMAQSLGEKIDRENELITGVMKSDKRFLAKKTKQDGCASE